MGFAGALRKAIKAGTNVDGVVDAAAVSKNIVKEAERYRLPELSSLFSTKYVKVTDGKTLIGKSEADNFIRYARLGDYTNSFEDAFGAANVLTPNVRRSISKVLADAASELPDKTILNFDTRVTRTRETYKLGGKNNQLKTVEEMETYVKANPKLAESVNKVVKEGKRTGFIKMFGYTLAVSGGVLTAATVYEHAVKEAAKNTGCFLYTKRGNGVTKCKISKLSCQYPSDGKVCSKDDVPASLSDDKTGCVDADKDKPCAGKLCDSNKYDDLAENQVLRCEQKSPGDVLAEMITELGSEASSAAKRIFGGIFKWLLIVIVAIVVIFLVFRFILNRFGT